MKTFQIVNGVCYWDATKKHASAAETQGKYPPDLLFVDAPDNVFEGWGYDDTQEGDARFIQPTPPNGWLYDPGTGTFYPATEIAPSKRPTIQDDITSLLVYQEYRITLLELGV